MPQSHIGHMRALKLTPIRASSSGFRGSQKSGRARRGKGVLAQRTIPMMARASVRA